MIRSNHQDFSSDGALLAETFGLPLLSYLCASPEEAVDRRLRSDQRLRDAQEQVLTDLLELARHLATDATQGGVPRYLRLEVLARYDEVYGTSTGNALRVQAGGDIDISVPDDPASGPLVVLLRDSYPLLLVPIGQRVGQELGLTTATWSNPRRRSFESAVLRDEDLSRLFVEETDSGGWMSNIYRSTGAGGSVQLSMLANTLLLNAWRQVALGSATPDRETLAQNLVDLVDLLRTAARGEPAEVKAFVAFAGVVFDGVDSLDLPFGTLRPSTQHESDSAPTSLEGAVSATTEQGGTITASYAGDLVLETTMSYQIRVERFDSAPSLPPPDWPSDLRDFERLQVHVETVGLASLLPCANDDVVPSPMTSTWRLVFDPLAWGPLFSWSDARSRPSWAPRSMNASEAEEFRLWAQRINSERRPSFDVAIRRTLSAAGARTDPQDSLVDLVIAWENLLGSRQGEPTLRVSAALGWLLASDSDAREEVRGQAAKIYALRSDVVHGNRAVPPEEATEALQRARRMTVSALRMLFDQRTDLLSLRGGDDRSRALIMGG